ncbi:MAG: PD-(D/E)XK nuclease family protein [Bacteroidales bacterium]|nr:PD-(D/E)XK nuclease family protein [Bacteroidales bacterium]
METITTMLNSISKRYEQQKKLEEKKREQGDFFNVFNTIGLRTEEVRLHSAFIAELLNPKGSHGLSQRFLQAFWK